MSNPTKSLFEAAKRLHTLVEGVEIERVNSGFEINVVADEFSPAFKNKKQSVAFLSELAAMQGVDVETIRETANYEGRIPSDSGLSGWEWSALSRILPERRE